jgi:hypothetical protein
MQVLQGMTRDRSTGNEYAKAFADPLLQVLQAAAPGWPAVTSKQFFIIFKLKKVPHEIPLF